MFLLNLGFVEFLTLFGAASGLVVTLYLLSRSRRKLTVSTLKFWTEASQPVSTHQRRKIQQPWSLILQLLSLLLLLLAVAQLRLGSRETSSRDHVLILDTSSWMAASLKNGSSLLDSAKVKARAYLRSLPSTDRVMLVRAEGLASPATSMESDRAVVLKAIDESRPAASALNLEQALSFAGQVEHLTDRTPGETVFIGSGRLAQNGAPTKTVEHLRVIPVSASAENCGITRIGIRRSPDDGELWQVFVSVRNYGKLSRTIPIVLQFGGATIGSKRIDAGPGQSVESTWQFRTKAAGWVEARLLIKDSLAEDDRAILEIPQLKQVSVAIYTSNPALLRPAFDTHPQVNAIYRTPEQYQPDTGAQVVVFDGFAPKQLPVKAGVIFVEPPDQGTPFRIRTHASNVRIEQWQRSHDLGAGLRSKNVMLARTTIFAPNAGDLSVAETHAGPVILARPQSHMVAMGFHPGFGDTKFDVSTPLLIANILHWMQPEVFRSWELRGGSVGSVAVTLDSDVKTEEIKVLADQRPLPFTVQGRTLRFFAGEPGDVRVVTGGQEQVHSLSLPEVGEKVWEPPQSALRGIPGGLKQIWSRDVWQLLAILGTLGFFLEWLLFGTRRSMKIPMAPSSVSLGDVASNVAERKAS